MRRICAARFFVQTISPQNFELNRTYPHFQIEKNF